jgi:hypothetical protein
MHRRSSRSHRGHRARIRIRAVLQLYSDWRDETSEDAKFSCLLKTAIELESSKMEDLMVATSLSTSSIALVHARMLLATWFGPLWRFNLAHPQGR